MFAFQAPDWGDEPDAVRATTMPALVSLGTEYLRQYTALRCFVHTARVLDGSHSLVSTPYKAKKKKRSPIIFRRIEFCFFRFSQSTPVALNLQTKRATHRGTVARLDPLSPSFFFLEAHPGSSGSCYRSKDEPISHIPNTTLGAPLPSSVPIPTDRKRRLPCDP